MKRKYAITAGIMAFMLTAATGCGSRQVAERTNTALSIENEVDESTKPHSQSEEGENGIPAADISERNILENDIPENNISENDSLANSNSNNETMCIIGGKVRSIAQDSFVISRTLMEENSSIVIMPEEGSPEEELVAIRCTDSTVFEHWTIQGGGAGIVKKEASFSDIQSGGGLEAEGYFDREEFVAEKVIIEVYE